MALAGNKTRLESHASQWQMLTTIHKTCIIYLTGKLAEISGTQLL